LIICVLKPAVEALLGRAAPPGFQPEMFADSQVFRMPGPYARSADAEGVMRLLSEHLERR
jgi:hypothetical protein